MKLLQLLKEIKINNPSQLSLEWYNKEEGLVSFNDSIYGNIFEDNLVFFNEIGYYIPEEEITNPDVVDYSDKLCKLLDRYNIPYTSDPNDGDGGTLYYSIDIPLDKIQKYIKD